MRAQKGRQVLADRERDAPLKTMGIAEAAPEFIVDTVEKHTQSCLAACVNRSVIWGCSCRGTLILHKYLPAII